MLYKRNNKKSGTYNAIAVATLAVTIHKINTID